MLAWFVGASLSHSVDFRFRMVYKTQITEHMKHSLIIRVMNWKSYQSLRDICQMVEFMSHHSFSGLSTGINSGGGQIKKQKKIIKLFKSEVNRTVLSLE